MSISIETIKRLPLYLRILKDKSKENIQSISATSIANELNLNPIQVRKDLASISKKDGKPGIGFEVSKLIEDIDEFLELKKTRNVIIVGAGRLGQALLNYNEFENEINTILAFDKDEKKCNDKNIFHINKLKVLIKEMDVQIGIITVPKEEAQEVCNIMIENGIKAIWNFAPINLQVPSDVVIKNEDLSASLSILIRQINREI